MSIDARNTTDDATYAVEYAQVSDLGMRRANNQDAVVSVVGDRKQWRSRGHLFVVADGMGAHAAGELASKMAVDNVPHAYQKAPSLPAPAALRQAVQKVNALIHEKGQSSGEFNGMGTTCVCLALLPGAALVAHVGDSRVYRLRDRQFEQLTFDHSLVWEMAAASKTTAEEVPDCIPSNVITRSLGPNESVNVDLEGPFEVRLGDKYLLCSDGLTGVVSDELIGSLVDCLSPKEAADTLVDVANLRGGPDNISIIIAEARGCSDGSATGAACDNGEATEGLEESPTGSLWSRWFGWLAGADRCEDAGCELGGPYGNGPYRTQLCSPEVAASEMDLLCRELTSLDNPNQAPMSEHPSADWLAFRKASDSADASAKAGQHQAAVVAYAAAIRHLMKQVREGPSPDDSSASHVI